MTLKKYREKRTFTKTPEPTGESGLKNGRGDLCFVVHKHDASHLHFDLRLELDGALKSWAVPKGPSVNPKDKRLAMMVEDHPLDYQSFEGIIPEGNYGAGTVMIWDRGIYQAEDAHDRAESERLLSRGLQKGHLKFVLEGQRLKGAFSLVRMRTREENAWLLIKKDDDFANTGAGPGSDDRSVVSDRSMEEIAKGLPDIPELKKGPRAPMPAHVKPMLATLVDKPFNRKDWFFEIKWDGYRMLAEVQSGNVRFYSRNDKTLNERFPSVVESLASLPFDALLDGELVITDESGKASFQKLQNYLRTGRGSLIYYVFDLLYLDGHDLRALPLEQRKGILKQVLPDFYNVKISDHVEDNGVDLFELAKKNDIEGIVAKNGRSRYRAGIRTRDWLKIKAYHEQEAVIAGFTEPRGGRKGFGALVLGAYDGPDLTYIGHAGGGFTDKELTTLEPRLRRIISDKSPFRHVPKTNMPVTWVQPGLVCQVRFTEWTDESLMRHPVFLGIREDVEPKDVRREREEKLDLTESAPPRKTGSLSATNLIPFERRGEKNDHSKPEPTTGPMQQALPDRDRGGNVKSSPSGSKKPRSIAVINDRRVKVTNREKIFWPEDGLTKGDLIDYYRDIAPFILPYLKDRPESLNRHPDGIEGENFFQKNMNYRLPTWARTVKIRSESDKREINYLVCNDEATLIHMANLGCIEINPWHSQIQNPDKPDYMVLDIDPLDVPFQYVVEAALKTRQVLQELDILCFCKTSGATGLHIYVPLAARYDYDQVRHFAQLLNTLVHSRLPDITSIERSPRKRQRRVYLDFLQNGLGQTLAAPYCIRPRKGATASTPLHWDEVNKRLKPEAFTMKTLPRRLSRIGDIWQGVLGPGVDMEACLDRMESTMVRG